MTDKTPNFRIDLRISDRKRLEDELDEAVDKAIRMAMENPGKGILVTRHDAQTFKIEHSAEVPRGIILEDDTGWRRGDARG